jgi:hypothetical protein
MLTEEESLGLRDQLIVNHETNREPYDYVVMNRSSAVDPTEIHVSFAEDRAEVREGVNSERRLPLKLLEVPR